MANFIEVIKGIQQETFYLDALEQKDMSLFEEQQMAFTLYGSDVSAGRLPVWLRQWVGLFSPFSFRVSDIAAVQNACLISLSQC